MSTKQKRKICVITGSRAEYGLLYWLLRELQKDPQVDLILVATGMHLAEEFGATFRQIESDGFRINCHIEMLLSSDTPTANAKSTALGLMSFADYFKNVLPDIIVILGDRFEIFAAASAALFLRIPIAHIHGGETSEGAYDEALRHSITKMSHIHFTAAKTYRRRVIQLGEAPDRVFNVGAPGLEHITRTKFFSRPELEETLGFRFLNKNLLVTYHPVTLAETSSAEQLKELLAALDELSDLGVIFTKPNADAEGRILARMIDEFAFRNKSRVCVSVNLGQTLYLSVMKVVDVVVGNSSSGLIEAPALRKATVNIGERQNGRLKAMSVIDCPAKSSAIIDAIMNGLSPDFQEKLENVELHYGVGESARIMADILKKVDLQKIIQKKFFDFPEGENPGSLC